MAKGVVVLYSIVCDAYNAKLRSRAVTKHLQAGVSHNTTKKQSTREVKGM